MAHSPEHQTRAELIYHSCDAEADKVIDHSDRLGADQEFVPRAGFWVSQCADCGAKALILFAEAGTTEIRLGLDPDKAEQLGLQLLAGVGLAKGAH